MIHKLAYTFRGGERYAEIAQQQQFLFIFIGPENVLKVFNSNQMEIWLNIIIGKLVNF